MKSNKYREGNKLKTIFGFLKSYKLLSLVILGFIASIILYFTGYHHIANLVLGITTLVAVMPLLWDMITTLRNGSYGIDILAATAMITSVILGQYWAGVIIALMLTGGEALEDYAENRAKAELTSLINNQPKIAHLVLKNKDIKDIAVNIVKVNDRLSILPGEVVPADCQMIEGDTSVDESSITGEATPIDKIVGDQILSGSINIEGSII